ALSLGDVVRKFRLHLEEEVQRGQLRPRTVDIQATRAARAIEFLKTIYPAGANTKLTTIDGDVFHGYLDWRLKYAKEKERTIRLDVVRDELLVIRKMFKWAKEKPNRWCSERSLPNWDFEVEQEGPKRERITPEQFKTFSNTLFAWSKEGRDHHDIY